MKQKSERKKVGINIEDEKQRSKYLKETENIHDRLRKIYATLNARSEEHCREQEQNNAIDDSGAEPPPPYKTDYFNRTRFLRDLLRPIATDQIIDDPKQRDKMVENVKTENFKGGGETSQNELAYLRYLESVSKKETTSTRGFIYEIEDKMYNNNFKKTITN